MFVTAVILVVVSVYYAVQFGFFLTIGKQKALTNGFEWMNTQVFLVVASITLAVIAISSLVRITQLSKGGSYVAENLGGRLLNRSTNDTKEKRLLNVVEEMAIASGVPVPQVYLLHKESGINAFAAGHSPSDAVIGVTTGCLEKLNREELQGVIAHEYSHILNGDMRLNIRLIGLLFGITAIANIGLMILRGGRHSGSKKGGGQIMLVALALLVIGYVGQLFGRMIQCAVSRQREYLADASAVQFTRNPGGIAGALIKIGGFKNGSRINSPNAPEASHMFFSLAVKSLFSTHPPLRERIHHIMPEYKGKIERLTPSETAVDSIGLETGLFDSSISKISLNPQEAKGHVGRLTPEHVGYSSDLLSELPLKIKDELDDMLGALSLVCALLLDKDPAEKKRQISALSDIAQTDIVHQVLIAEKEIRDLESVFYFPVLEIAIPTLKGMSPLQYDAFKHYIKALVEADGKLTLYEYAIQKVLNHHLGSFYSRSKRQPTIKSMHTLAPHIANFLSMLAKAGQKDMRDAGEAFNAVFTRLKSGGVGQNVVFSESVSFTEVDEALNKMALASSKIKSAIFDACCETVLYDKEVTIKEAELLRTAASIMDIPVPPFLSDRTV